MSILRTAVAVIVSASGDGNQDKQVYSIPLGPLALPLLHRDIQVQERVAVAATTEEGYDSYYSITKYMTYYGKHKKKIYTFPSFTMNNNIWSYFNKFVNIPIFEKKQENMNVPIFGEKMRGKYGRLKNCAKKMSKIWKKKTVR